MAKRAIICAGDTTSHGGKVLEGNPTASIDGKPIAGVGHKVFCPLCKGDFAILPDLLGRRYPHVIDKRDTAVEGMRTACGAVLIASQSNSTIDDTGHAAPQQGAGTPASAAVIAVAQPLSPSPTLCLECLKAAAESGATTVMRG
ncbi:PAAR domain-containing protein [Burkholderia pseudomallei]|uniref:PAAR domain-containing protein n=1 Tax=Burkholderia pseudomallei TaxID=28450 RepID=UPI00070D95F2|nr:PAAR domain-containing protein [Burkholderia pseudomallei]